MQLIVTDFGSAQTKQQNQFTCLPEGSAHRGWLFGMEMDLYKSQILDGNPDGIWYKNEIVRVGVSNCMHMCLISFGTKHTHSLVPGIKEEALIPDL